MRPIVWLCCALAPVAVGAQDELVIEDFDDVDCWRGFELSTERAHSGKTSARWANMDKVPGVTCADIPHDWSAYGHFTFWVYVEKPVRGRFMCIIRSENPKTEGMDYWAVGVSLNIPGWRRYGVRIGTGGTRSPLGWDQVQAINFTASGWGNTPNPEAVVYIDQMKLTNEFAGPGPVTKDPEFFNMLRDDIPGLTPTRQAAAAGDYAKAKREFLRYMRSRKKPVWRFDWREWDKQRQPNYDTSRADRVCQHVFSWFGREANLGPDIDWTANGFDPAEPDYTPEWTYNLNRFGAWVILGRAYWATGDEKYAREFVAQMTDWIRDQPMPVLGSPNTGPCWRTIEQGIRCAGSWMDAYHYFLGSPSMTPEAHCTFVKSFTEHAKTLTRMAVEHPEHGGNWVTMEMNGLAHVAIMFPEFKDAAHWRQVAYDRLLMELDRQVYPDGAQKELTTGYHQVARGNFMGALRPAQMNDVPVPEEYLDKLERMYRYNLYAMMPDGRLPPLNDAGMSNVVGSLREAWETWKRPEYLWGATLGKEGKPLDFTS
ncbi:MAG: heparinase II/III family protein, partial [Armatimonadota bacterium]